MNNKRPIPKGFRGWDYTRFIRQKKNEANWICSICGWQAKDLNDRINIIAHHPNNDDLFQVDIICEACHYNQHWAKLK